MYACTRMHLREGGERWRDCALGYTTSEPTRSIRRKCNLLSHNFCYEYDIFNLVTNICGKISQLKSHEILRRFEEQES